MNLLKDQFKRPIGLGRRVRACWNIINKYFTASDATSPCLFISEKKSISTNTHSKQENIVTSDPPAFREIYECISIRNPCGVSIKNSNQANLFSLNTHVFQSHSLTWRIVRDIYTSIRFIHRWCGCRKKIIIVLFILWSYCSSLFRKPSMSRD